MQFDADRNAILSLMKKVRNRRPETRRTTLTLPESLLRQAERLARERHRTLSSVVAGLLGDALRNGDRAADAARRQAAILNMWKTAYVPANEEEALLLEGIVLDEPISTAK